MLTRAADGKKGTREPLRNKPDILPRQVQLLDTHSLNHPFVLIVAADPDPDKAFVIFNGKSPVVESYPNRPKLAYFLEMERGVARIRFQQPEVTI